MVGLGPQCAYGHQICKNSLSSLVRSFFLSFTPMKEPPPLPPQPPPSPSFSYKYEKSNTPTLKNAQPATPDRSSRLSYPEKLRAPTGVEYTKGSSAGLSDVLSDVSARVELRVGHFSFIECTLN